MSRFNVIKADTEFIIEESRIEQWIAITVAHGKFFLAVERNAQKVTDRCMVCRVGFQFAC
jgi:hypothetical protein